MGWASGSIKRIGFKGEGSLLMLSDVFKRPTGVHRVDEYVSLLEQFSGKIVNNKQVTLSVNNTGEADCNQVLINFNSEAASRRMPIDKGIAIINLLTDTFKDAAFTFIGSPKEAAFIEQIIARANNPCRLKNLAGKTSLVELAGLMARSTLLLTTDSGPAHLANSVGTPVVVLFGAGNEHNTAPYNRQNLTIIRYGKLSCEPCVKNTCELYGVPKCMELIDELRIIDAMSVYLPHA
jgi:ADP-heptose:LPS heptosyltransferase